MVVTANLSSNTKSNGKITEKTVNNKLKSWRILRPLGSIVLPFEIKKKASLALPALRIESLLENIVSIAISCMSLEMLWLK